jgi:hypothetical protein
VKTHQIRDTHTGEVTSVPLTADEETEVDAREARVAALAYRAARKVAYANLGDQLDMQYWDQVNGTTTWKAHVAKVKSDNPKPE